MEDFRHPFPWHLIAGIVVLFALFFLAETKLGQRLAQVVPGVQRVLIFLRIVPNAEG